MHLLFLNTTAICVKYQHVCGILPGNLNYAFRCNTKVLPQARQWTSDVLLASRTRYCTKQVDMHFLILFND